MFYTHSGVWVAVDNESAPTIADIGYHLGQITRFGGGCNSWWSVLHHLFNCHDLGLQHAEQHRLDTKNTLELLIHLLLHDAHKAVTSDIPKPWKSEDMHVYQAMLDERIYDSLNLNLPSDSMIKIIEHIDQAALVAESYIVYPSLFSELIDDLTLEGKMIVLKIANTYNGPNYTIGIDSPGVTKYISLLTHYLDYYQGGLLYGTSWSDIPIEYLGSESIVRKKTNNPLVTP